MIIIKKIIKLFSMFIFLIFLKKPVAVTLSNINQFYSEG
jgi:hypothetical protein